MGMSLSLQGWPCPLTVRHGYDPVTQQLRHGCDPVTPQLDIGVCVDEVCWWLSVVMCVGDLLGEWITCCCVVCGWLAVLLCVDDILLCYVWMNYSVGDVLLCCVWVMYCCAMCGCTTVWVMYCRAVCGCTTVGWCTVVLYVLWPMLVSYCCGWMTCSGAPCGCPAPLLYCADDICYTYMYDLLQCSVADLLLCYVWITFCCAQCGWLTVWMSGTVSVSVDDCV